MSKTLIILIITILFTPELFSIQKNSYTKVDAAQLYKKCSGCHGVTGEKKALGRSKVINQMRQETLVLSIRGYQNGTYGGAMKGLMKGQVFRLEPYEVEALSSYIAAMGTQKEPEHPKLDLSLASKQCQTTRPSPSSPEHKPLSMKIKTKRYINGVVYVKTMIYHKMLTVDSAKKRGTTPGHIKLIRIKEDDHLLLELKTTAYLSMNPIFKLSYNSFGGKRVSIEAKDTSSKENRKTVLIKEGSTRKKYSPKRVEETESFSNEIGRRTISKYFSNASLYESKEIRLTAPDVASNGGAVPLGIRSTLHAKRVIVFASEEDNTIKMVCQWILHETKMIDFEMKIKLMNLLYSPDSDIWSTGVISVVIEGEDGKYYIRERKVSVAIGGGEV